MLFPVRSAHLLLVGVFLSAILGIRIADAQTFSATGSLDLHLVCQTATALQNGTILIAGGFDSSGSITTTAEIYNPNPAAQSFAPTGQLNALRTCGATAALLNDGTVLVVGGSGDTTAELYYPSSGTFKLRTPPTATNPLGAQIGLMTAVRYNATETVLQDGTVLIAGGDVGDNRGLKTAEIYNPATGTFTATGLMNTPRTTHSATLLANGTVLIAGGQGNINGQAAWNTAEIFNPSNQTFTLLVGQMTTTRAQHTATLLTDGTVLLVGGQNTNGTVLSSAEIYTPASGIFAGTFAATGSMSSARFEHTATQLADGTVLVTGGLNGSTSPNVLISAEIYNPSSTKAFSSAGNMTVPRALHTATRIFDGRILIAGGENSSGTGTSAFLSAAELYSYPVTVATMAPAYRVTSILYTPPGNKSQDGFTDTTTAGTTTTIGNSFTDGTSVTMGIGFSFPGIGGATASQSFATSTTSSNTSAFQESYTNATSVANQSNGAAADAINHNNDLFLIWLNPQLTVFGNQSAPVGYSVGIQPLADGTIPLPDIIEVFASAMEANSVGVTTVPSSILNQKVTTSGQLVPGLASICKKVINTEYSAGSCTLADQCGCTPADFLPILQTDPLLFFNGPSNPISPYPGTASPLTANTASASMCGALPVPSGSDCRYVPVPNGVGSTQQEGVTLEGPNTAGGNNPTNTFQQGENTQTTYTLGGQHQTTVGQNVGVNVSITGTTSGGPSGSLTWGLNKTMTWTDSQSVGTASGSGSSLSVTLSSSTVGCAQENNIGVFEDTIYHTFVFQQPPGDPSACTSLLPAFSITTTPSNPGQAALSLGHSISYTVNASALNGFNGTVALSVSGLPSGVTASFSPASITTSSLGSATLRLTAAYSNTTFIGNSTVTVTGTSGSLANSAIFSLTTQPLQYKNACGVQ
jgi:Galactose oxidase, central domain